MENLRCRVSKKEVFTLVPVELEFRKVEEQTFGTNTANVAWFMTASEGTLEAFVANDVLDKLKEVRKGTSLMVVLKMATAPGKSDYYQVVSFMTTEAHDIMVADNAAKVSISLSEETINRINAQISKYGEPISFDDYMSKFIEFNSASDKAIPKK